MNPAYHPQTDEQLERNIQTLEVMLMICILDWKGSWGKYLPLAQFAYDNSYSFRMDMALYENSYGRHCRTPPSWPEVGEWHVIEQPRVQETTEMHKIQLKETHES